MCEKRSSGNRSRKHCRIGKRRHLVAKVRSRNNRASHHAILKALCPTDADQRQTNRRDSRPGTPGHNGHHGTHRTCGSKKELRMYDPHAVIDEPRHYAAHHPGSAQRTDHQQNQDGRHYVSNPGDYRALNRRPRQPIYTYTQCRRHSPREQQSQLARAGQRISTERTDRKVEKRHQHDDWNH